MRQQCRNFAVQSHQPGGEIGQTHFILDGKCPRRGIAGSNPARAAIKSIYMNRREKIEALRNSAGKSISELIGKPEYEMMRKRHAHYSQLIADYGIKTAREIYDHLKELFELYGVCLTPNDEGSECLIHLQLDYNEYEDYTVVDNEDGAGCIIIPTVAFKYCFANVEGDIFKEEFV